MLTFAHEVLLHVSRGVRWDSDHVVTLTDDLQAIAQELVRGDYLGRMHIGLDYFDASINRMAAWVIGTRDMQRALLMALLEPSAHLAELERAGDYTSRLALQEALKTLPAGAVWDTFCLQHDLPVDTALMGEVKAVALVKSLHLKNRCAARSSQPARQQAKLRLPGAAARCAGAKRTVVMQATLPVQAGVASSGKRARTSASDARPRG